MRRTACSPVVCSNKVHSTLLWSLRTQVSPLWASKSTLYTHNHMLMHPVLLLMNYSQLFSFHVSTADSTQLPVFVFTISHYGALSRFSLDRVEVLVLTEKQRTLRTDWLQVITQWAYPGEFSFLAPRMSFMFTLISERQDLKFSTFSWWTVSCFPPLNLNLWLWVTSTSKRLQTTARTGVLYWTTTHKPPASFMLQQGNTKHARGSHRPPHLHHVTSPRPKLACAVVGASVNEKSKVLTYKALKLDFFYLKYSRKSGDKNIIISLIITVNIWRNWNDQKLFQQLRLQRSGCAGLPETNEQHFPLV